jgi:Protein of unknown function (DUF2975)
MTPSPLSTATPRLLWISRGVRALALVGMVGIVGYGLAFWTDADWVRKVATEQWKLTAGSVPMEGLARLRGAVGSAPGFALALWALWQLWALFGWYGRGEVFHPAAIHHLRRFGQAVIIMAPVMAITDTITVLALTLSNPPGHRILMLQIGSEHYVQLLLGLVLLAIGQVMSEAQRMAQENAEFV